MLRVQRVRMRTCVHLPITLAALMLIAAVNPPHVHADTPVGGAIVSDTTWPLAHSPYLVVQSVVVSEGVTLTIEPGVVVRFNSDQKMQINGTLVARGTVTDRITFTSSWTSPLPADWESIQFTDTSTDATFTAEGIYTAGSILQYCTVEYGGRCGNARGAIETQAASPFIDACIVRHNGGTGIAGTGSQGIPVNISGNTVSNNWSCGLGGGIYAYYGTLTGNTISDNGSFEAGGGIHAYFSTVMSNTLSGNGSLMGNFQVYVRDSTVTGNAVTGHPSSQAGGIWATDSIVTGNTVSAHRATYDVGGIQASNSTVTGNIVRGNSSGRSGGGIDAYNSTVMSNTVGYNSSTGHGGGIYAVDSTLTGNIVFDNSSDALGGGIYAQNSAVVASTIVANSVSAQGQGAGLYFLGSEDVLNNTVLGNTGLTNTTIGAVAISGAPPFHHNNLYGNEPYDVLILSTQDISGTHNFWGTVSNDDIQEQVYDWYDDGLRGRLLLDPYSPDPDPVAPVPPPLHLAGDWYGESVSLTWDPIPSTTTSYGYNVYYDSDRAGPPYDGTGLDQGDSPVDVSSTTAYTLTGLTGDTPIYIAVTAYEMLGREGWYSNEVNNLAPFSHLAHLPLIVKHY